MLNINNIQYTQVPIVEAERDDFIRNMYSNDDNKKRLFFLIPQNVIDAAVAGDVPIAAANIIPLGNYSDSGAGFVTEPNIVGDQIEADMLDSNRRIKTHIFNNNNNWQQVSGSNPNLYYTSGIGASGGKRRKSNRRKSNKRKSNKRNHKKIK